MCEADEAKKAELKELWQSLLRMANLWSDSSDIPRPEEALIDELINKLGKIVGLGREEVIETPTTKGSMLDRLAVRDGIHKRLSKEKLGVLVEDLRIQAPIPSSEGGVVLLDVPGINDPRSLHKKETRDAISLVSLIMLVLDKAVIDKATEKMLEENPVLERMLLAEDADCDLIVVGIAEKGNDRAFSCPEDRIADFDQGGKLAAIINTLLRRKACNLVKSKQLDRDVALARVKRIFDSPNRFSVLPVLPCLASSYHLSPANRLVHEVFCESPDEPTCPLNMEPEELKQKCLKTNIPQLLQRIHLIRRPPIREDLIKGIESALDVADHLTAGHKIDMLVAEFLKLESCHVLKKKPENITLEEPPAVDTEAVTKIFEDCATKSCIDINDLEAVKRQFPSKPKIIAMLGSKAVDDLLQLEAMCLRGFQPKNIGPIAEMLMKPVEQQSSLFIDRAVAKLINIRNGSTARLDGAFDIVADSGGLGFCTSLYAQLELRWRLTLRQTNARCLDQGRKRLRMALNAANDKGVTHFLKQLKQCSSASFHKTFTDGLSQNVMARKAADVGISSVQSALQTFWDEVADSASNDVQRLWKEWQEEIQKLAKSVAARLTSAATKEGENDNGQERDGCLIEFLVSLKEQKRKLEELKVDLRNEDTATGPSIAEANYGYSLLQKDQQFTFACDPGISQPPVPQAGEQEKTVDLSDSGRMDHGVPRLSLPSPRARKNLIDCGDSPEKLEIQGSNVPMRERPSSRTPLASPRGPSDPWTSITREIGSPSQAAIDFRARRRGDISPHGIKKQRVKELSEEEVRQLGTEHPSVESKRKKYVRRP